MLGYPDEFVEDDSVLDFKTSKVGGRPSWLESDFQPPESLACPSCKPPSAPSPPVLLAQIYAPLEAKSLHRTIYIFTCPKQECQNNPNRYVLPPFENNDPMALHSSRTTVVKFMNS